jgi:phospholipid N-methyltransferase
MVEKIFFQSSMPRAGSTLIQNILAQNPNIYATPTSGLCELLLNVRNTYSNGIEFKAQDQKVMDEAFKGFCKNASYGFYNNITDRKYVIDKCRGWSVMYDFINWYDPDPKILIMVRDIRSVVSSLEKKFRKNQHLNSNLQNWESLSGTTVDKRVDLFLSSVPPLHLPLEVIYDIILRKISQKCLFIKFEEFNLNPENEMQKIYNYLKIPHFKHDYNNIKQFTKEDDTYYRPFGDHEIRSKVEPVEEDFIKILGKHNCNNIIEKYKWFYKAFNYNI